VVRAHRRRRSPSFRATTLYPSNLISCSQPGPAGGLSASAGWQGWMKPGGLERDRIGRETRQSICRRERKGGAGSFNRLWPRLRIPHAEAFIRLPLAAHEANERSSPSEWKSSLSRSGGPECRPLLGRWNGGARFGILAIAVTAAPVRAVFGECAAL
jgi:hypothetical protein